MKRHHHQQQESDTGAPATQRLPYDPPRLLETMTLREFIQQIGSPPPPPGEEDYDYDG